MTYFFGSDTVVSGATVLESPITELPRTAPACISAAVVGFFRYGYVFLLTTASRMLVDNPNGAPTDR
jgi:hypothetical protein